MTIPLSLYIHIPWCVKKCPYCDFNSHEQKKTTPERDYIEQMLRDLEAQLHLVQNRPIHSIFVGGGTPSLFQPESYNHLFESLKVKLDISPKTEITLEANPGTTEAEKFKGYFEAGINRLSLGAQSFQDDKLKLLGRIHQSQDIQNAIAQARAAGFSNINIDLMFGLPNQSLADALFDLKTAIALEPNHLSWYQLTLEPNTYFHRFPPVLPSDDARFEIQEKGQALLAEMGFKQYEISAYTKAAPCQHNVNYWQFGDYLGIGAGAHAKLTDIKSMQIYRRMPPKNPKQYLATDFTRLTLEKVDKTQLPLEFMMNALRLHQPIHKQLFEARTGLSFRMISKTIQNAQAKGLLTLVDDQVSVTAQGRLFLNELLEMFL